MRTIDDGYHRFSMEYIGSGDAVATKQDVVLRSVLLLFLEKIRHPGEQHLQEESRPVRA